MNCIEGKNFIQVPFSTQNADNWEMPLDAVVRCVRLTAAPGMLTNMDYVTIHEAHGAEPAIFVLSGEAKATLMTGKKPTRLRIGRYFFTNFADVVLSIETD